MMFLRVRVVSVAVLASLNVEAFSVHRHTTDVAQSRRSKVGSRLFMADGEKGDETTFVSSVFKKEIAYDEKTGRFFETGYGEGECIPDEEFCITDNESGDMIRLTVEEKERIFLDALQVRLRYGNNC